MKINKVIVSIVILVFLILQSSILTSAAPYSAPYITLDGNTISWEEVDVQYGASAPTAYHIYRKGSDGSSASFITTSLSYTIQTQYLDYDVTYSFYVKATAANTLYSPASNTVQFVFHSYYQNWKTDSSSHWFECRGCGYKESEEEHVFDNSCDSTCGVCYYTRIINHYPDNDDGNCMTHIRCKICDDIARYGMPRHSFTAECDSTCNNKGCMYVRITSHSYTKLKKDATDHWYACRHCDLEQPNSRSTHSGGSSSCQVKANCEICHIYYGEILDHSFTNNTCSKCGTTLEISTDGKFNGVDTTVTGDITVPLASNGVSVSIIGAGAFKDCASLSSVMIYDNITEIADDAFEGVSDNFVIKCYEDSPASVWAEEKGVNYEIVPIPYGNVNADGATDIFDLIALAKHTVDSGTVIDTRAANTNAPDKADRNIDIFDLIALAKHICNPEFALGPKA